LSADEALDEARVPGPFNQLAFVAVDSLQQHLAAVTSCRLLEGPRHEQEVPGSRLDDGRPRKELLAERVADRTDAKLVSGTGLLEESDDVPNTTLLLGRNVQASLGSTALPAPHRAGQDATHAR